MHQPLITYNQIVNTRTIPFVKMIECTIIVMFILAGDVDGDDTSISNKSTAYDCDSYYSTGSTVCLHPGSNTDDAKPLSWLKVKCRQIFRRKTLLMRVPVLQWLPNYSKNDFLPDLIAGVTVGVAGF